MAQIDIESATRNWVKVAKRGSEKGAMDSLYGCISDDSFQAPEELPASNDSPRESFNPPRTPAGGR